MHRLIFATVAALSLAAAAPAVAQQGTAAQPSQSAAPQHGSQSNASANLNQDEIRQAQQALNKKGFNVGEVDGMMGPKTSNAIKEFQQKQGLNNSGQLDDQTLEALGVSSTTTGQSTSQPPQQHANPGAE